MKFGGSTGGRVCERLAAGITLDVDIPILLTPKGEALTLFMASRNHPIGVRKVGEFRGLRKLLRVPLAHRSRVHR